MNAFKKLQLFFDAYPDIMIMKGQILFGPDKKLDSMYYLKEGFVRQYAKSPKGDILYLHIYKPGSFFPLMWLYTELDVRYYYETLTTCRVVKAPMPAIREYIAKNPDIPEYFVGKLLLGIDGLLTRLESLVLDSAYTKTALFFLYFAKVFGKTDGKMVHIETSLSHKQISDWIGTARETATLAAEALRKKGLIRYTNRRYTVSDLKALDAEITASRLR